MMGSKRLPRAPFSPGTTRPRLRIHGIGSCSARMCSYIEPVSDPGTTSVDSGRPAGAVRVHTEPGRQSGQRAPGRSRLNPSGAPALSMTQNRLSSVPAIFVRVMKFGQHSSFLHEQPVPSGIHLYAILGWSVAHGAGSECLEPGRDF
ncbi:hypothetical protein ABIB34_004213 [Rhodococcus sp. UYP5]